jgi:hypothetical protein
MRYVFHCQGCCLHSCTGENNDYDDDTLEALLLEYLPTLGGEKAKSVEILFLPKEDG